MPRLARLARPDVGQIGSRALCPEHRRVLERIVTGARRAPKRAIHREVTHELRVTESAALAQVDHPSALLLAPSRGRTGRSRVRLFAQGRQHRHHEREHEEHDGRRRHDGVVVRVQSTEAHAGIPTASGAGAGTRPRNGRMAHTLAANTMWLPAIRRPPIVRQSHNGSAAITDTMNDWPATQASPWRIPAAEIATT